MHKHRYRQIIWFFGRVILHLIWWDILLPRLGLSSLSRRTRPARFGKLAASFRSLAIRMGGVMIKVGQFLSARLDVLPVEVTNELARLQDEVKPEPFARVRGVVEQELGSPISDRYSFFDENPLASASIGQVHRAHIRVPPGEPALPAVVVKVQRPDIRDIVEVDLSALRVVGAWIQRYPPVRRRANIPALLAEFSSSLHEEIDYLQEGKNAEVFAKNFRDQPDVCVPRVYWSHTTTKVLTLEDVWSIKITDYPAIEEAGVHRADVAQRLFRTYLKQIFEDQFFHADPHPGNLFVFPATDESGTGPTEWKLVFVDFGMVGRITPHIFDGLRELLIAIGTRDAARIVTAYKILGVLLPAANTDLIEKAGQRAFERFWGKTTPEMMNLRQTEAVEFAKEFGNLLYELPFQVPENLILLGRCFGILSGMCTGLDPDFNVWTSLAPYARKLVETEGGNRLELILKEVGNIFRILVSLPARTEALLNRIEQGRLEVKIPDLDFQVSGMIAAIKHLSRAILAAAFLLSSIQLFLAGKNDLALLLGIVTAAILLWFLFR